MKKYLFLLATLFFSLNYSYLVAQCPTNITFNSQSDIDDFPVNYPNCTDISGYVKVAGSDITNVDGLSNLISIGDYLSILNCDAIIDLDGFDNLTSVGDYMFVGFSDALTTIDGFNSLTSIGGDLDFTNNNNLADITGFSNLSNVPNIDITFNPALTSIGGLNSLTSTGFLLIRDNLLLSDISGLSTIVTCGNLTLEDTAISDLSDLSSLSTVSAYCRIINNGNLIDLSGFTTALNSIGIFLVSDNDNLTSLSGLPSTLTISQGGDFLVARNNALLNLSGLPSSFSNVHIDILDNDALTNLSGLDELSSISNLSIRGNANLADLSGLPSQSSIGGLLISNTNLSDLSGLPSYSSVTGTLNISNNSNLNDISILSSITSVGSLTVNNNLLSNLNSLNSITSLNNGILRIQSNNNITSLVGLENIDYNTIQRIFLTINSNLSICELQNICDFLDSGGLNTIAANATGCATFAEVQTACQNPLPVELIFFRSFVQNKTIKLSWQTSSELNNLGFEVHKSQDGKNWSNISWVNGKATNTGINDYKIIDQNPFSGLNYYRLKQIDFDGHFEFSDIVAVNFSSEKSVISIYPNPSNDYLTIKQNDEINDSSIEIFDSLGRLIYTIDNVSTNLELNVSKWETGLYFIHFYYNNLQQVEKFVKM